MKSYGGGAGTERNALGRNTSQCSGDWPTWDALYERNLSWNQIWGISEYYLSFLLKVTYDMVPTLVKLKNWQLTYKAECCVFKAMPGCLEHWLSGFKWLLPHYTYRYNQVMEQLAGTIRDAIDKSRLATIRRCPKVNFNPVSVSVALKKTAFPKSAQFAKYGKRWGAGDGQ